MAQTFEFPGATTIRRRPHRTKRPTGNKFQEIATRSPEDMKALDVIADHILARLNERDGKDPAWTGDAGVDSNIPRKG